MIYFDPFAIYSVNYTLQQSSQNLKSKLTNYIPQTAVFICVHGCASLFQKLMESILVSNCRILNIMPANKQSL